jgi:hypothetical protein
VATEVCDQPSKSGGKAGFYNPVADWEAEESNLRISSSSRAKAFTTRAPRRFCSILVVMTANCCCILSERGRNRFPKEKATATTKGVLIRAKRASLGFIEKRMIPVPNERTIPSINRCRARPVRKRILSTSWIVRERSSPVSVLSRSISRTVPDVSFIPICLIRFASYLNSSRTSLDSIMTSQG